MGIGQRIRGPQEDELLDLHEADGDRLIAGYRIERLISRDPWRHTTYEATTSGGRAVVLKLLTVRGEDTRRLTKRVRRRLELRASIEHPHLLPVLDWGSVKGRYYLVTPLSRVPTLADLLTAAPLKMHAALRLLSQLADGLEAAHEQGLVHRNLAPDEVLVGPDRGGHVLLGDFGVADPDWGSGLLDVAGSLAYLPPERLREEPLVPESNVYSLACILVECLTGTPPYASEHPGIVGYAHVAEPAPRLSERRPELSTAVDDVVAAAMTKDPEDRPSSPRELVSVAAKALGVSLPQSPGRSVPAQLQPVEQPPARAAPVPRAAPSSSRSAGRSADGRPRRERPVWPGALARARAVREAVHRSGPALAVSAVVVFGGAGFVLGRAGDDPPRRTPPLERPAPTAPTRATAVALERLDARRGTARKRLAAGRSSAAQARYARRLAAAYGAAYGDVPRASRPEAQLASALNEARRAYVELAGAARRVDRRDYSAAARSVRRSERDVEQAIARLNRAPD